MAKKPSDKINSVILVQRKISEMFGEIAGEASGLMHTEEYYKPPLDIYETEESLNIEIEIPGMRASDMELYFIRNTLYFKARKYDTEPIGGYNASGKVNFICMERKFGLFKREISVPATCNSQMAKAVYRNGVLSLEIPKVQDRRGRRVNIPIVEED